ncbi:MAG: alpha/beta hydrolase [Deltaproteobacteria bacterium]|nr:alpha/beta hydrolase [Deltaproteobacteria bacterium]
MPLIKVKDIGLYYEFHGEGEPLVLLSGTGLSCENWNVFQLPDLRNHFRVLLLDYRGTGRSDKPDMHYSTRMFAEDAVDLMHVLGIDRAHVMGHSMGGRVAQWVAIDYPDSVAGLILSGTGPGTVEDGQYYQRGVPLNTMIQLIEKGLEQRLRDHFADGFMFPPEFVRDHPETIKRLGEANLKHPTPLRPYLRHIIARQEHETRHLLHKIKSPTLVVCGSGDRVATGGAGDHVRSSECLAANIAGAELVLVQGGNHSYLRQMPEKANAIFVDFLKRHPMRKS